VAPGEAVRHLEPCSVCSGEGVVHIPPSGRDGVRWELE
jgi:hypothetical protein